ncbi:hypothetical protein [Rhodococcus sp. NPDC058514]
MSSPSTSSSCSKLRRANAATDKTLLAAAMFSARAHPVNADNAAAASS